MKKLLFALALTGCASTQLSPAASAIVEADEAMVAECKFLGTVMADSAVMAAWTAGGNIEVTKSRVLSAAAAKGATHIVWKSLQATMSGGAGSSGAANAYKCR